jgi:hypothetical protein
MLPSRTAIGLTLALLALPATATARPADFTAGGETGPSHTVRLPYRDYYGAAGLPDSGQQTLVSPDAADAARAGDIAKAMEHYQRSQPIPAAAQAASPPQGGYRQAPSDDNTPAWPEIAIAGFVVLASAGGVVSVRMRRRRTARVAA